MPNAAETVEAPYTAAERLTFLPQPARLRMELDKIPLWRGEHVSIRQLIEDFCRYSYLPRLQEPKVLLDAVRGGISLLTWEQDTFAYAESYDEAVGRYRGLRTMESISLSDADPGACRPSGCGPATDGRGGYPSSNDPLRGLASLTFRGPGEAPSTPGAEPSDCSSATDEGEALPRVRETRCHPRRPRCQSNSG